MLLQDEQYVVKWLSQWCPAKSADYQDASKAAEYCRKDPAEPEKADADLGCVRWLLHWAGCHE